MFLVPLPHSLVVHPTCRYIYSDLEALAAELLSSTELHNDEAATRIVLPKSSSSCYSAIGIEREEPWAGTTA